MCHCNNCDITLTHSNRIYGYNVNKKYESSMSEALTANQNPNLPKASSDDNRKQKTWPVFFLQQFSVPPAATLSSIAATCGAFLPPSAELQIRKTLE